MIAFRLRNIQSIVDQQFEFPDDKGLVQFLGHNSNGKSILGKVVSLVVFQQVPDDEERLPLIRDGEEEGSFSMQWGNKVLGVLINRDVNKCLYIYKEGEQDPIRRLVKQGGIDQIIRKMGFLVYGKNEVCLQLCETYGPMPFVNTRKSLNGEIVNACCTDLSSENFIKNYAETFREAKKIMNSYKVDIARNEAIIESTGYKNYEGLDKIITELKVLYRRGCSMPYVELSELNPPTCVRTDLDYIGRVDLQVPLCLDVVENINPMLNLVLKIQEMYRGKCPTCGRYLMEDAV